MGMSVSGVSNSYNYYGHIASGRRINSAADDAAGLTIAQKMTSQSKGTQAAMDNITAGTSALNIADGALSGVTDYLQSIKELSIKAANGTNSLADKQAIQSQIDQYKQGINDIVGNTQYNTLKLLNGDHESLGIVADANGEKTPARLGNSAIAALGLEDYDVTGDFDMSRIDDAISRISSQRSGIGASTNALQSAYNYSANTLENVDSSLSSLEDLDIPKAVSELKKNQLLNDIAVMMQKKREEDEQKNAMNLFM